MLHHLHNVTKIFKYMQESFQTYACPALYELSLDTEITKRKGKCYIFNNNEQRAAQGVTNSRHKLHRCICYQPCLHENACIGKSVYKRISESTRNALLQTQGTRKESLSFFLYLCLFLHHCLHLFRLRLIHQHKWSFINFLSSIAQAQF